MQKLIFQSSHRDLSTARPLEIKDIGAFCIWELGIVAYEKEQWKKYLASQRTLEDKLLYLHSTIAGDL